MARTLYRIYLYGVWLFLMVFATIAVGVVLGTLVAASPLNGSSQISLTGTSATQEVVFALLAVVIAALLGGLHYWLIRRDIRDDPAAATGPVRALFLNGVEAVAVLVGVPTIAVALASLANPYSGGVVSAIAAGLVALGLFALLETERRRSSAAPGAALVLQRLHFYGVQLILLFIATSFWLNAIGNTVTSIFINAGLLSTDCGPDGLCFDSGAIGNTLPNLIWLWAGAAFVTLALVGYGLLARHDGRSALRLVLHFVSFGYGLIFVLVAVFQAASLILKGIQSQPVTAYDFVFSYEFLAPAVFGVLVVAVYASWLARDAMHGSASAHTVGLTALAVTVAMCAVPFWIGCALVAFNLLSALSPATVAPSADEWTIAVALLIAGVGYVPFSLRMRVLARRYTPATPRRGLVFALLGAGTLTAAIGLIVTLFAILTAAAGAALGNWQVIARAGVVVLLTGALIAAIYFSRAQVEGWFRRVTPAALVAAPVAAVATASPSVAASDTAPVGIATEPAGAASSATPS
ncbi:MAG: hypothetical protein ACRDHP_14875, partial [Ktedonobacterales bacterium]